MASHFVTRTRRGHTCGHSISCDRLRSMPERSAAASLVTNAGLRHGASSASVRETRKRTKTSRAKKRALICIYIYIHILTYTYTFTYTSTDTYMSRRGCQQVCWPGPSDSKAPRGFLCWQQFSPQFFEACIMLTSFTSQPLKPTAAEPPNDSLSLGPSVLANWELCALVSWLLQAAKCAQPLLDMDLQLGWQP